MLIENPIVKELLSGECTPRISETMALNNPLAVETRDLR